MPRERKGRGRPPGDLTPPQWANLFDELRRANFEIPQIAKQTGKSRKTVANLLRVKRQLDPVLFKVFSGGDMKQTEAERLAALDSRDQRAEWRRLQGGSRRVRPPKEIEEMIRTLEHAADIDEKTRRIAVETMNWALDRTQELLGHRLPRQRRGP